MQRIAAISLLWLVAVAALPAVGDEPTKVALTLTKGGGKAPVQKLGEELLKLMRREVERDRSLKLVEHQKVDVNLAQRLLDRSQAEKLKKQFGKLLSADYLLMLETLPAERGGRPATVRLRVVDAQTSAVRGVLAAGLESDTLGRTADEFVTFARSVTSSPEEASISVAVTPFDSLGHFDRLRPLELKIRDSITARLIKLSVATSGQDEISDEAKSEKSGQAPKFQVLQRSNLGELIHERELTRSGLAEKSDASKARPATYLVRGRIDERVAGDEHTLLLEGEMIDVATRQPVKKFQFECGEKDLEKQLSTSVDSLAAWLSGERQEPPVVAARSSAETEALKQAAVADLEKMTRRRHDNTSLQFSTKRRVRRSGGRNEVATRTPQGRAMLEKSIERLESVLLENPEDTLAAYCLGFCYSSHQPGIYQPERADELFRKVVALEPESDLAGLSLEYLTEIASDDSNGRVDRADQVEAYERLVFAFEQMPEKGRGWHWADFLSRASGMRDSTHPGEQQTYLIELGIGALGTCGTGTRSYLAGKIASIAAGLAKSANKPDVKQQGEKLLRDWTAGDDLDLVGGAALSLADVLHDRSKFEEGAEILVQAEQKLSGRDKPVDCQLRARMLLQAAHFYRIDHKPSKALELLNSDTMETLVSSSVLATNRSFERACCYEDLKQPKEALSQFLKQVDEGPTTELANRIVELGGIPLRPDREINVRYYSLPPSNDPACLATDGKRIYLGTSAGLRVFDLKTNAWGPALSSDAITSLYCVGDQLWVGTAVDGLWRRDNPQGKLVEVVPGKLPDRRIESIAVIGSDVYVGVGRPPSGGLVRIDSHGQITAITQSGAPAMAPTHLVVSGGWLLASTGKGTYSFDLKSNWSAIQTKPEPIGLFRGEDCVWGSSYSDPLVRWDQPTAKSKSYQPDPKTVLKKVDCNAKFVVQHGRQVWIGGNTRKQIKLSGLYRFDLDTEKLDEFAPADGFKTRFYHLLHDGLWIDGHLWLATSEGLCRVTPLGKGAKAAPPADERPPVDMLPEEEMAAN